jgi:xylan 1,4-beta-xylosidase
MKFPLWALAVSILVFDGRSLFAVNTNSFPVTIKIHADKPVGELKPIWRFFGADEPNYATMPNGKKLIGELGQLRTNEVFFRTHNLLTSGDGTPALKWGSTGVYVEDTNGNPVYHWTILDCIFDTYRERGVRPYVEIGFMPEALSIKPEPYQHNWIVTKSILGGWAFPPKDYAKWSELVYQWTKHDVERYGHDEVENWYWETWNEPNIFYWQGKPQEFFKLHDDAVDAVRRALPDAKVGGPDSAGGGTEFLREFLEHCLHGTNFATGKIGTPLDFVSFHAKGSAVFTNDHVRMSIANQLRDMDSAFKIIASFPELKNAPIVIGESDPDTCAACQGDQFGYRNGAQYVSYTAASIAREFELAEKHGVNLEGALTWAFEFEGQPPFAGFRALASDGIDLPVLNVFRMFSKMEGKRLTVESDKQISLDSILKNGVREQPDVFALAGLDKSELAVLVWHYADDDLPGADAEILLALDGLPLKSGTARVQQFRIDADHGNSFTAWQKMNSPLSPTPEQFAQLEKAGQLAELGSPKILRAKDGKLDLRFSLPRQAVSLLIIGLK